jgi:SMI1 / KNR4 family (SUKH-1)
VVESAAEVYSLGMTGQRGLLDGFNWADHGAGDSAVVAAEGELGLALPADYLVVLRAHDGGEGWVGAGGAYLNLWSVEELVESNRTFEVREFTPGTVLIGSNGGGEMYGIRVDGDSTTFLKLPAVGMSNDQGIELGGSWDAFLQTLAENR